MRVPKYVAEIMERATYNPHDFKVYDLDADVPYDEPVPCVYSEK